MVQKCLSFRKINLKSSAEIGGKAFNLVKLFQKKFPVPEGFVLTTRVYQEYLTYKKILPTTWKNISKFYYDLNCAEVAVRSSASLEDGMENSFAGQFATILQVKNELELKVAIIKCYSELIRVKKYGTHSKRKPNPIALIIQKMVPAQKAGVLFTVNPVTKQSEIVINAYRGLGESVVSGKVNPEEIKIDRSQFKKIRPGSKTLLKTEIKKLCQLALKIEQVFKVPQDIEWAITSNKIYILQARPITALKNINNPLKAPADYLKEEKEKLMNFPSNQVWSSYNIAEVLPAPAPFTLNIMQQIMSPGGGLGRAYRHFLFPINKTVRGEDYIQTICGRIYINLLAEEKIFFKRLPLAYPLSQMLKNPELASYPQAKISYRRKGIMNILFSPWWFLQYLLAQFLASQQRSQIINHFYSVFQPTVIACSQELEKINFVDYPLARLNDLLSKTINYYVRECSKYTIEAAIISHISWESLKNLMLKTGLKAEAQSLFFAPSLPNQTIRLHQAAYELRWREITKAEFLKKFGHRGMNELEFMAPRFGEDDQELQCFISLSKQSLAPFDLLKKVQLKKKNKLKGLERKLEYQPLLFYKITKEIALLEDCIQFRENVKDCLLRLLWQIRRLGLAIQTKLGIKDLFYLVPEEIINLANKEEAIAIIKERKQKRAELLKINLPTVIFQKDIEQLGTIDLKKEQHKLKGLTVCPGIIQGRVRVIRNKKILPKITKQTILVLPDADPVWTMLFAQARGLIIEKGGILSHSAIIAREYDIPTIINVSDATKILKDGQWVRMDAGKGEVVVE